jgi:serine phosphatase RsbU (regulator of sigma subunit)/CheY-like chemotaxis protein
MSIKPHVLCVDDERPLLFSLRGELSQGLGPDYKVEIADSAEEALEILAELALENIPVPVIISDQLMPGMKGDEFLIKVHEMNKQARKILLTGQASLESVGRAINQAGLYRFLTKPWEPEDLKLTVMQAIKSYFTDNQLGASQQIIRDIGRYTNILSEQIHLEGWVQSFLQLMLNDLNGKRMLVFIAPTNQVPELFAEVNLEHPQQLQRLTRAGAYATYPIKELETLLAPNAKPIDKARLNEGQIGIAYYAASLRKADRQLGYFYIESRSIKEGFNAEQYSFLTTISQQAFASLDNALLYESLEQKVKERTQIIEEKNRDITESIEYAKRIQFAILPDLRILHSRYPDAAVYYSPKDIVCGDFYWWSEVGDYFFIAAVDCTGHGVPGAFLSVLANSMLNLIIRELGVSETDAILETLHAQVITALRNKEGANAEIEDGMDIALIRLHSLSREVQFSGANRSAIVVDHEKYSEYKGDRKPIGGGYIFEESTGERTFSAQHFMLMPNECLYLFSDGLTDQFNSENKRKFTFKRLIDLLQSIFRNPLAQQMQLVQQQMNEWRGATSQTDDMLLIGLRGV